MKNIQVIDGADNATFSIFAATEAEFDLLFPNGTDILFACDIAASKKADEIRRALNAIWSRPVDKKNVNGIHGSYFADLDHRAEYFPTRKEAEMKLPYDPPDPDYYKT